MPSPWDVRLIVEAFDCYGSVTLCGVATAVGSVVGILQSPVCGRSRTVACEHHTLITANG